MRNNDHVILNGFIYDKYVSNALHMIRSDSIYSLFHSLTVSSTVDSGKR